MRARWSGKKVGANYQQCRIEYGGVAQLQSWTTISHLLRGRLRPWGRRTCCEDPIGFFQRLAGADVVPHAGNGPGVHRHFRVEPLDQAARLVGVVAFGDVLADYWDGGLWVIVESDSCKSAGRL